MKDSLLKRRLHFFVPSHSRRVPIPAEYVKFRAVGKLSEDVVIAMARFEECFGSKHLMHAGSNVNVILSRR